MSNNPIVLSSGLEMCSNRKCYYGLTHLHCPNCNRDICYPLNHTILSVNLSGIKKGLKCDICGFIWRPKGLHISFIDIVFLLTYLFTILGVSIVIALAVLYFIIAWRMFA